MTLSFRKTCFFVLAVGGEHEDRETATVKVVNHPRSSSLATAGQSPSEFSYAVRLGNYIADFRICSDEIHQLNSIRLWHQSIRVFQETAVIGGRCTL